jgi:hypothetical protein
MASMTLLQTIVGAGLVAGAARAGIPLLFAIA